jgi:hypothetical protein
VPPEDVNARDMLSENYLAVAKRYGCEIFVQHEVMRIGNRKRDGSFRVHFKRPIGAAPPHLGVVKAKQVVVVAGTLGSNAVLLRSKKHGLPLSDRVGHGFSGNGDMILGASVGTKDVGGDETDLEPKSGPSILVGSEFTTREHHMFIEGLGSLPILQAIFGQGDTKDVKARTDELRYLGMGTDDADGEVYLLRPGRK